MTIAGQAPSATYCHLLWDSAYIDQFGNVYACCHEAPGVLGNIYRDDMATIWTGSAALQGFREQSTSGRLECAPACNILTPEEKSGVNRPPTYGDHPRNIWVLYGELCNVACIMCPQDHRSRDALDREVLQRQVAWDKVREVELQGGEVLAIKDAKEFYRWLVDETRTKVNLITNGLLITEEWAERMVRGGNWIQVSVNAASKATHEIVNAGSKFDRAIGSLRMLVRAKRHQAAKTQIIFKYTAVPENLHELADAVELAAELGCDKIAFGYDQSVPNYLAAHPELSERLRRRFAELCAAGLALAIERNRLRQLGLIAAA